MTLENYIDALHADGLVFNRVVVSATIGMPSLTVVGITFEVGEHPYLTEFYQNDVLVARVLHLTRD